MLSARMTTPTAVGIVVAVLVAAIAAVVVAFRARAVHAAHAAHDAPPAGASGIDRQASRREVVNQGLVGLFAAGLAGVVSSVLTFLWPSVGDGGGRRYTVGDPDALRRHFAAGGPPYYDPVGRFYVVPYPAADLGQARRSYRGSVLVGMESGFVALSQACTHLGCRVPWCSSSRWFECPCHGSRFDAAGEQRAGPAPRGMDRYGVTVRGNQVVVDTRVTYRGPPPGTDTLHQQPAGRHCN